MTIQVVALGNIAAADDGAAMLAAQQLQSECAVVLAGRPGVHLLDMLDTSQPTVLVDVIRSGKPPGHIVTVPLASLTDIAVAGAHTSSHGFGIAETLRLGKSLGRTLPQGYFVGVEGHHFDAGQPVSKPVQDAVETLVERIRDAIQQLRADCDA